MEQGQHAAYLGEQVQEGRKLLFIWLYACANIFYFLGANC